MTEEELQRYWSTVGQRIKDREDGNLLAGDDSPYYQYKAEQFSARFLPRIPVAGLDVLDVGCGAGGTLRWMAQHNPKRLVGCDQAPGMIELATRHVPSAEMVQTDGDSLPFADQSFDIVTTVTVLQHNPDERCTRLLGEICRVSRGQVLLFEDTSLVMRPRPVGQGQYLNFYGRPVGWYAGVCAVHGFELIETQYLQTMASLRTFLFLWQFLNRTRRRKTDEGAPFSPLHLAVEKRTLPVTKRLDPFIRYRKGENTMMRFEKRRS
jgi:ubiquinone/menaquinone biosynthesis C-methylase UbiE